VYRLTTLDTLLRPTGPFLYKYSSVDPAERLEWLRTLLLQHQLYFPSPKELNDPADARPKLIVSSREGALRLIVNSFLKEHARDPVAGLAVDVRNMVTMVATLVPEQLAELMKRRFHEQMELHRIYSMTTGPDKDYLWTHYAADHTGYYLEFDNRGWPFVIAATVVLATRWRSTSASRARSMRRSCFAKHAVMPMKRKSASFYSLAGSHMKCRLNRHSSGASSSVRTWCRTTVS